MMRTVFISFLKHTIFLFCVSSFPPTSLGSISSITTTSLSHRIHHGNETDRLSLLAFKDQLIDDSLKALGSWNESTHFCHWEGVTCGHRHQRVVILNLSSQGLVGPVSPFIGNLSFLRAISLENNTFKGNIPPEISLLSRLKYLAMHNNSFVGQIPTNLGQCSNLTDLYFDNNELQGEIPNEFGSLSKLERLIVAHNNLAGKIPIALGNISTLQYLALTYNHLDGGIPTSFGQLKELTHLSLGGNTLSGTFLALLALHLRKRSNAISISQKYANDLQHISYDEIRKATSEFSSSSLIGIGSFASVYKGVLHRSESVIAVKVFNLMERGASKSFKAECEILRRIRHRNLLKILTVCSSIDFHGNDFKALILEFMPCGSLEDWLHPSLDRSQTSPRMLNILQMLNIAIDVASALDYLHNCNDAPIVHCDIKPSNVLLNEDLVACVGDFGLAKFFSQSQSSLDKSETNSNAVRGTIGYIPPEYGMSSIVSTKGDVYSYGIMLLEMFTGKRPTDEMFNDILSLHNFCNIKLAERDVDIVNILPLMKQSQNETEEERSMTESMKKCLFSAIEIGVACSSENASDRMDIRDVLMKMQKVKEAFVKVMNHGKNTNMESNI